MTPLTDCDYTVRDLTSRVVMVHGETAPTVRARHQMHTELDTQRTLETKFLGTILVGLDY